MTTNSFGVTQPAGPVDAALKPLGIYVHVPFCLQKCNYCDFVSFGGCSVDVKNAYVDKLCEEISEGGCLGKFSDALGGSFNPREYHVDTIFLGGGTPTLLGTGGVKRILNAIDQTFYCGCEYAAGCMGGVQHCDGMEITLESNPKTFTEEDLRAYMECGVNRLSIGVQSLDDGLLLRMGRIPTAQEALQAMRTAKSLHLNFNADLIFGLPGQTMESWEDTLKRTIEEEPNHVSFYSLQLEMGTPFYRDFKDGKLELPAWEENRAMYAKAAELLKSAGYEHYEVSNAAIPGYECKHNLKYWSMEDYLGFGLASHSFFARREGRRILRAGRCFTEGSLQDYLKASTSQTLELSENWDLKTDFLFTELRKTDGFDSGDYEAMFGSRFQEDFGSEYTKLLAEGLLEEAKGNIRFTKEGLDATNIVLERLINVQ